MRLLEDAIASYRAFVSLFHMIQVGKSTLNSLSEVRGDLHGRLLEAAVQLLDLPDNPEVLASPGDRGREVGRWACGVVGLSISQSGAVGRGIGTKPCIFMTRSIILLWMALLTISFSL